MWFGIEYEVKMFVIWINKGIKEIFCWKDYGVNDVKVLGLGFMWISYFYEEFVV